ncbi:MAG TPA: ATP-binding protein, partial [Planctomycetes bacterium]|nr:ATP-binding protein [Planctomycetota bacterium]
KSRRSFVFARAGYGKSNLVKYLVSRLYEHPPEVGLLILDPEGEYAFEQTAEGRRVPGLADHPEIRKRLKVFTSRKAPSLLERYGDVIQTSLQVDFRECEPGEVLTSFVPREKLEQVWSNWIRGLARRTRGGKVKVEDRWAALIDALGRRQYGITDEELHHLIFGRPMKSDQKGGNVSIQAVRNNLVPLVRRLHNPESRLLSATLEHLDRGGVVVLDLSLASHSDSRALADLLLFRVFQSRVQALTHGRKLPPVLAVFEEAQTILSASRDDETSIFTRWVKEGRKYGLGALMITQQPGSISEEIVSQGDNFFVMHLLNENDLRLLQRINAHFTEDILEFIRNEPVKGNCYFWSAPDQPYVVPCRVENFDNYATRPTRRAEGPARVGEPRLTPYERALLRALAEEERVYLIPAQVPVKGKKAGDLLAVSPHYLQATALSLLLEEGAPAAAVPKDPMPALKRMGILGPDGPWFAGEGGKGAPWILLDRGRLALACHRAGYTLKPARPFPIRLHPAAEGK